MTYNTALASRIEQLTAPWNPEPYPRKMFGGICYFIHGHMAFGIWKNDLVVRIGADQAVEALRQDNVRPFDTAGRPMNGWVMVSSPAMDTDAALETWLFQAKEFVHSLPPKQPNAKNILKSIYPE